MEIINDLDRPLRFPNPVVTIGNFDGVHRGHQKIFRRVVEKARERGGTPIVITFSPHPVRVLAPERGLKLITTPEDKRSLIGRLGIEALICVRFDKEFSHTEPDDFIRKVLVEKLGAQWVIVGHSYSFGKGKKGTTAMLRQRGAKYGFRAAVVRYATAHGEVVSSSRVRSLVLRGRVCEAAQMLGRAYHLNGVVVKGAGRGGPLLHTPTANLATPNELIPKEGVYAVRVSLPGDERNSAWEDGLPFHTRAEAPVPVYDGVANIGDNPTFGDTGMSYEVHLFDFNRTLVGERLRLHFIDRIRDELKFSSAAELEHAIKADILKAKQILAKRNDLLFV